MMRSSIVSLSLKSSATISATHWRHCIQSTMHMSKKRFASTSTTNTTSTTTISTSSSAISHAAKPFIPAADSVSRSILTNVNHLSEKLIWKCYSAEDIESVGMDVSRGCSVGDVLLLTGDLGSGKTCFARGFIRSLLMDEEAFVTSPSYLLDNTYMTPDCTIKPNCLSYLYKLLTLHPDVNVLNESFICSCCYECTYYTSHGFIPPAEIFRCFDFRNSRDIFNKYMPRRVAGPSECSTTAAQLHLRYNRHAAGTRPKQGDKGREASRRASGYRENCLLTLLLVSCVLFLEISFNGHALSLAALPLLYRETLQRKLLHINSHVARSLSLKKIALHL